MEYYYFILLLVVLLLVLVLALVMVGSPSGPINNRAVLPNEDSPVGNLTAAEVLGSHQSSVLLLSCIDFRFIDKIHQFMSGLGYNGDYDYFILAGASLGPNQTKYPAWSRTWWKHVELALELHKIKKIIIIDHEDCGAYDLFYHMMGPEEELPLHEENLEKLTNSIKQRYPQLGVEGYYMRFSGEVLPVTSVVGS